jgi:hypothetical protein
MGCTSDSEGTKLVPKTEAKEVLAFISLEFVCLVQEQSDIKFVDHVFIDVTIFASLK